MRSAGAAGHSLEHTHTQTTEFRAGIKSTPSSCPPKVQGQTPITPSLVSKPEWRHQDNPRRRLNRPDGDSRESPVAFHSPSRIQEADRAGIVVQTVVIREAHGQSDPWSAVMASLCEQPGLRYSSDFHLSCPAPLGSSRQLCGPPCGLTLDHGNP